MPSSMRLQLMGSCKWGDTSSHARAAAYAVFKAVPFTTLPASTRPHPPPHRPPRSQEHGRQNHTCTAAHFECDRVIPPCAGTASQAASSMEQVLKRDCSQLFLGWQIQRDSTLTACSELARATDQALLCHSPPPTLEKSLCPLGNSSKAAKKASSPFKHPSMKSQTGTQAHDRHTYLRASGSLSQSSPLIP